MTKENEFIKTAPREVIDEINEFAKLETYKNVYDLFDSDGLMPSDEQTPFKNKVMAWVYQMGTIQTEMRELAVVHHYLGINTLEPERAPMEPHWCIAFPSLETYQVQTSDGYITTCNHVPEYNETYMDMSMAKFLASKLVGGIAKKVYDNGL